MAVTVVDTTEISLCAAVIVEIAALADTITIAATKTIAVIAVNKTIAVIAATKSIAVIAVTTAAAIIAALYYCGKLVTNLWQTCGELVAS